MDTSDLLEAKHKELLRQGTHGPKSNDEAVKLTTDRHEWADELIVQRDELLKALDILVPTTQMLMIAANFTEEQMDSDLAPYRAVIERCRK